MGVYGLEDYEGEEITMSYEFKEGLGVILFWIGAVYVQLMGFAMFEFINNGLKWGEVWAFIIALQMCIVLGFGVYFLVSKFGGAKLVDK